ncbi:hypothetical protein [Mesobacillus foraminis]|uniref:hypothetical protein n=1 Tax=Mesobacillus foraminis TaxID=279826 RepID=UPI000EF4AD7A|nr:hypothetical protein [Mesobacillus foraminis]
MKKAGLWILFLVIVTASYLYLNRERPIETSMTSDFIVTGKSLKSGKNVIEVDLIVPENGGSGVIMVRNKSDWDKIQVGETYFAMLNWTSLREGSQVFEEETYLEQWEKKE